MPLYRSFVNSAIIVHRLQGICGRRPFQHIFGCHFVGGSGTICFLCSVPHAAWGMPDTVSANQRPFFGFWFDCELRDPSKDLQTKFCVISRSLEYVRNKVTFRLFDSYQRCVF